MRFGLDMSLTRSGAGGGAALPAFTMENRVGTTVTDLGSREWSVDPTANGWGNATATSVESFAGDFIVRYRAGASTQIMCGVTADPVVSNHFDTIDFAMFFSTGAVVRLFENGIETAADISGGAVYSTPAYFFIKRIGTALSFGNGGTDGVTGYTERATRTSAATLFVKVASNSDQDGVEVKRIS